MMDDGALKKQPEIDYEKIDRLDERDEVLLECIHDHGGVIIFNKTKFIELLIAKKPPKCNGCGRFLVKKIPLIKEV